MAHLGLARHGEEIMTGTAEKLKKIIRRKKEIERQCAILSSRVLELQKQLNALYAEKGDLQEQQDRLEWGDGEYDRARQWMLSV